MARYVALFLSSVVLFSGCGKTVELGDWQPYVAEFEAAAAAAGRAIVIDDLIIEFGELEARTAGVCETRMMRTPRITIQRSLWPRLSETKRQILLFHELGHCVLGREHTNVMRGDGIPTSLMHPRNLSEHAFLRNQEYYLTELFRR